MQKELITLVRENILSIRPYVPGKPIEEVEREIGISDIIKLASNENPLGPSPKAVEAIIANSKKVSYYPDGNSFYLKETLAKHLGVKIENLIVGNGSDEILKLIAEAFLKEGEESVYAEPSFVEYEFATKVMGGTCVAVPLKDYKHDLDAMLKAITEKTKLVFVCNPNNPTGTIVSDQELSAFINAVPENVIIVIDEAYYEYVQDKEYSNSLSFLRNRNNLIILRTFSKVYGLAGMRVGYGIASEEMIALINRVKEPFNVNLLGQAAAIAAIGDKDHLEKSVKTNDAGKVYLYNAMQEMGLDYIPTEANFFMVNIKMDSRVAFQRLLKKGVIIRTGDIFGMPEFIRVTIGTPEENKRFVETLKTILAEGAS